MKSKDRRDNGKMIFLIGAILNFVIFSIGIFLTVPLCCMPVTLLIPFYGLYEYFRNR